MVKADSATDRSPDPSEETLAPLNRVRQFLREYLIAFYQPAFLYRMFQRRMRPKTIQRIQLLFVSSALLVVLFWPEDLLLDKSPELVRAFAYWRSFTVLAAVVGISGLKFSRLLRDHLYVFSVGLIFVDMVLAGYLFGSVKGLEYPWFDFLVFLIPMFSVVLSIDLIKRFLTCTLLSFSYVGTYLLADPENVQFVYFADFLPLWATVIVLNTLLGHSIFYFDFLTFRNQRTLEYQQQEIERLARHDPLTGLYNRSEFNRRGTDVFERSRRYDEDLTVAMLDLDHFKAVNDIHGHATGDRVLERTGQLIRETTRSADVASRYGGEEFCLLMPRTDLDGAVSLVERLRRSLAEETFETESGETLSATVSVGVAERTEATESLEDLLKEADEQLYRAKDEGRNCVRAPDPGS